MMGVRFTGHPELKRILMWDGYAYYPLRKDFLEPYYEGPTKVFDSRVEDGRPALPLRGVQPSRHEPQGPPGLQRTGRASRAATTPRARTLIPGGVEISELDTDQFVVSMGPQHPSTHGVFRMNLRVDGETIVGLKPVMGYMHRNHEKIGERNTFLMNFPFTDRLDYLTSMGNNFGYALAIEQLMGDDAKPPERAEYIRVIMAELTRVASHMWSIGFLLNDLGAFFTPAPLRDRGARADPRPVRVGRRQPDDVQLLPVRRRGLRPPQGLGRALQGDRLRPARRQDRRARPLPLGQRDRARPLQGDRRPDRRAGDRLLDRPARSSAPRASPTTSAARRPTAIYDRFDFNVVTGTEGDVYDRYYVRLEEMRESVKILKQALRDLPEGPILPGKKSYQIKVPAGEAYSRVENPKGELGYYVVADGSATAYRYHVRSPSFINLTALEQMCLGHTVADVVGILGSLDIVLGEVDR